MPLDWNAPGLDREYLIGPRFPEDLSNQAYYPNAQFVPHPVPEVREIPFPINYTDRPRHR